MMLSRTKPGTSSTTRAPLFHRLGALTDRGTADGWCDEKRKMTAAELAEATRQYDHGPAVIKRHRVPASELRKLKEFMKAPKRSPGRPRLGSGAARVLFTIDPELLIRIDNFAKARGMKRSHLIAISAEDYMRRRAHSSGPPARRLAG